MNYVIETEELAGNEIIMMTSSQNNLSQVLFLVKRKYTKRNELQRTGSHLDVERFSYESKKCGAEVNRAVASHRHVHSDKFL